MAQFEDIQAIVEKIADEAVIYFKHKAPLIKAVRRITKLERELTGGVSFLDFAPLDSVTPTNWNPATCEGSNDVTLNRVPIPVVFDPTTDFYRIRVPHTVWESRMIEGGFDRAFKDYFVPLIDGFARIVSRAIAARYVDAENQVGTGGTPVDDATFREGLKLLGDHEIDPEFEPLHSVWGTDAYWLNLLDDTQYNQWQNSAQEASLVKGKIEEKYFVTVNKSTAIVNSAGSAGATTHNMLFHEDAIGLAFIDFEKIGNMVAPIGQNVVEARAGQSEGLVIRVLHYYDFTTCKVVYELTMGFKVYTRFGWGIVDVLS